MANTHTARGFTLVEILITVAIVGILATIAVPSYNRYIERGYLSQAYTDLLAVNSNARNEKVKNPQLALDDDKLKGIIRISITAETADRYVFETSFPDGSKSNRYHLAVTPKAGSGYTLSLWSDSLGNAYRCTDAASAKAFSTTSSAGKGCEPVGSKGI